MEIVADDVETGVSRVLTNLNAYAQGAQGLAATLVALGYALFVGPSYVPDDVGPRALAAPRPAAGATSLVPWWEPGFAA